MPFVFLILILAYLIVTSVPDVTYLKTGRIYGVSPSYVLGGWIPFPRSQTLTKLNASQLKDIPFGYSYIENQYFSELGLPTGYRWKVMCIKESYDALEIAINLNPVKILAREFTVGKWTEWYNVI